MVKKRIVIPYCRHRVIDLLSYTPERITARCIMCNITLTPPWIRPRVYTANPETGYWIEIADKDAMKKIVNGRLQRSDYGVRIRN